MTSQDHDHAKIGPGYHRLPHHHRTAGRCPAEQRRACRAGRAFTLALSAARKRLERDGYIIGYRAALRRERVGLGFSVFVGVKIDSHANERALTFEEAVCALPEVIACHLVSGEADYFLEVVVPDLAHYQRFLVGRLLNMPIVREVRSNIAIQTVKAGAPLPLGHLA